MSLEDNLAKELNLSVSPTILIGRDKDYNIQFWGNSFIWIPQVFIETISLVSQGKSKLESKLVSKLRNIDRELLVDIYFNRQLFISNSLGLLAIRIAVEFPKMIKVRFRGEQKTEDRIGELALLKLPAILINGERDSLLTPPISETEFIKRLILYGAPHRKELIVELEEEEKKKFELVDNPDSPILLSHKNFDEAVRRYVILVVDFWAQWCAPCLMLAPIIERLAKKYKGKIVFGKLNIEENQEIASRFGIMSIPTLIIFKKGNIMDTLIGVMPESTLEEKFNMYLEKR